MFGDLKEAAALAVGGEFPPGNMSMAEAAAHVQAQNATWLNIHQGSNLNLYIDYPLRSDLPGGDRLEEMVSACHALGMHVKLCRTVMLSRFVEVIVSLTLNVSLFQTSPRAS